MLVTNSAWSPTLLNGAGLGVGQSGIIMAAYNGGSVVGTLVAAVLVSRHWGIESLYVALGAPGLCAALFVLLLGLEQTRRNGRGDVS
jgi:predicted MFS family arabinose efflux permease